MFGHVRMISCDVVKNKASETFLSFHSFSSLLNQIAAGALEVLLKPRNDHFQVLR